MKNSDICCGDCLLCKESEAVTENIRIDVAVVGSPFAERTAACRGFVIRLRPLSEISSILDKVPDVVLNLVDSRDLYNSLYPATKLMDLGLRTVTVLEKYSDLLETDHSVDLASLEGLMGFPVVTADMDDPVQFSRVVSSVVTVYQEGLRKLVRVPYGNDVEKAISDISREISRCGEETIYSSRYLALRLLEKQDYIMPYVNALENAPGIVSVAQSCCRRLEKEFDEPAETLVAKARRGFINGALQETLRHSKDDSDHTLAQRIDALLTNRWLGLPLLVAVLFLVFQATFALGAYPQMWIENLVDHAAFHLHSMLPPGWLSSMLIDGIVRGVGAVVSFLPNIIILFFFLSLLEDSGYMARAAYIMDKIMHRIGLHGRSFIPMLIGFGCNVPAIMAARSIDDRKDRTLTMLMIPFMSCSARLPVYMLFVSAFFARYKALVMMGIYVTGIILSIIFAFIMKHTRYFRKDDDDFVSELPAFRRPTIRNTGAHIWERVSDYLKKITTVILAASVVIWALEYFPKDRTNAGENREASYLCDIGRWMEPVMRPLGFDWKMNVCILTGLPAKEAIVSTMGILYHSDEESLPDAMRNARYTDGPRAGENIFTTGTSLSFMVFVLLYFPCIATVSALKREAGRKWAVFTVIHSLLLAWVMAFIVFNMF